MDIPKIVGLQPTHIEQTEKAAKLTFDIRPLPDRAGVAGNITASWYCPIDNLSDLAKFSHIDFVTLDDGQTTVLYWTLNELSGLLRLVTFIPV